MCELKTDRTMGGIGDLFMEKAMIELLVAVINVRYAKVNAMESKTRHSVINPEEVSRNFSIGIEKVKEILRVTTQKGIRHAVHPFHKLTLSGSNIVEQEAP